ncbi:MAG: hypothetical protein D6811_08945 [Alphaproteobacteria bacterium]|nr:MAG: hypothetical protein D6811_08945 [Alphaproteobacteria bacterium]
MKELTAQERAALARIGTLDDPERLRNMIANARRMGSSAVEKAAFERLCELLPEVAPGTVEHDVWKAIHALEEILKEERGKTVRLSRTRQKIQRDGEIKTVADLTLKPEPSQGFLDLAERDLLDLSFEAVVLHHPEAFDEEVVAAARARLAAAGYAGAGEGKDTGEGER